MPLLSRVRYRVSEWRPYLPKLFLLILLANLPDFDFLIELGFPAHELHRGFTHSLIAAIVVSLGLGCIWRIVPGFWRSVLLYFAAYGSHLSIDLCTGTHLGWSNSGSGIPLFWPWHQQFSSPLILVYGVHHGTLAALFSLDNAFSSTYELLTFGGITAVLLILWKQKLKPQTHRPGPEPAPHPLAELQPHK